MTLSPNQIEDVKLEIQNFFAVRRPEHGLRDKVDLNYIIKDQSVEIVEVRPQWNKPSTKIKIPVAKATYVKSKDAWKIYWMRSDLEWHGYEPQMEVKVFKEFLEIENVDDHGCFFG